MKANRLLIAMATSLCSASAFAQLPAGTPGPVGDLDAAVSALGERIAALEAAQPTPNVEGRTYCFVQNQLRSIGVGAFGSEVTQHRVIRRTVTFSNNSLIGQFDSHVINIMRDNGTVIQQTIPADDPLMANYVQYGRKLDVEFLGINAPAANWYVSADGSMIAGTTIDIDEGDPADPQMLTVGTVRNFSLVESEFCDPEGM